MGKKIGTIIFNIVELIVVILIGLFMKVDFNICIFLCVTFFIVRATTGKPMHYKAWYRCAMWSSLTFFSLYLLSDLNLLSILFFAVFTAIISTGKADITNIFMWKGNASKHEDIMEYVKLHPLDNKLLEFEEKLKSKNDVQYLIYKYIFKEGLSFQQIEDRIELPTQRISEELNSIALAIRVYCDI